MNEERYKMIPVETLDRILEIADNEELRIEKANRNENERMESMRLNLKNNTWIMWTNIINVVITSILMLLVILTL